jgi:hypothetical protein
VSRVKREGKGGPSIINNPPHRRPPPAPRRRAWPALRDLTVGGLAFGLAVAVAMCPSLFSRLASLRLGATGEWQNSLLLSPLGRLSALTELSVAGAVDPESAG